MDDPYWNNVSDCHEQLVSLSANLSDYGFPDVASDWVKRIESQDVSAISALAIPNELVGFLTNAMRKKQVCFAKEIPEDRDLMARYFLIFGETDAKRGFYPIFIQMMNSTPDWDSISEAYCDCPPSFRAVAETLPAIGTDVLDNPSLLLPSEMWTNHSHLYRFDDDPDGNWIVKTPVDVVAELEKLLLINLNYWSVARLLDSNSEVIEYHTITSVFNRTGERVEQWLDLELAKIACKLCGRKA